jgi:hypothetical protein
VHCPVALGRIGASQQPPGIWSMHFYCALCFWQNGCPREFLRQAPGGVSPCDQQERPLFIPSHFQGLHLGLGSRVGSCSSLQPLGYIVLLRTPLLHSKGITCPQESKFGKNSTVLSNCPVRMSSKGCIAFSSQILRLKVSFNGPWRAMHSYD